MSRREIAVPLETAREWGWRPGEDLGVALHRRGLGVEMLGLGIAPGEEVILRLETDQERIDRLQGGP